MTTFNENDILARIEELIEGKPFPGEMDELCEGLRIFASLELGEPGPDKYPRAYGYYLGYLKRMENMEMPHGMKTELAKAAGVSRQYLSAVLSKRKTPSVETAKRISNHALSLGMYLPVGYLLGLTETLRRSK